MGNKVHPPIYDEVKFSTLIYFIVESLENSSNITINYEHFYNWFTRVG